MFVRVLEAVTRNPQVPIGDIDLLGDLERRELTPAHGLPEVPPKLWPELLADAVAIDPDSVACRSRTGSSVIATWTSGRIVLPGSCAVAVWARRPSWHWECLARSNRWWRSGR